MELWIRTQDRMRLVKPNRLAIKGESKLVGLGDWYITESQNSLRYATYSTKERALEVLDEISNILKLKNMYEYDRELVLKGWQNYKKEQVETVREQMSVYEMPEE